MHATITLLNRSNHSELGRSAIISGPEVKEVGGGALLDGDTRDGHVTEWLKGSRDRFILQRKSRAIPPAVLLCV